MRFSYATHAILRFLKVNKIACNRKCQSIFVQNGYIMSQRFKISDKLSFVKIQKITSRDRVILVLADHPAGTRRRWMVPNWPYMKE